MLLHRVGDHSGLAALLAELRREALASMGLVVVEAALAQVEAPAEGAGNVPVALMITGRFGFAPLY